jgi:DegV family protein with EDD domain
MKIAIVTDSTADIPADLASTLQINVIPTILVMENISIPDDQYFSRDEFYAKLPQYHPLPTTAAPATGVFEDKYQQLLDNGAEMILSIHIASLLSGVCNVAATAAQSFPGKIRVIDSQQVSMGLGFQVIHAARAAQAGQPVEEILNGIVAVRTRIRLVAMLNTLEYLRRSGRVSWAKAWIGNLLNVKPFVEVKDGQVLRAGDVRTRNKGIRRLMDMLQAIPKFEELAILHTHASDEAEDMRSQLELDDSVPTYIVNVTPVIGTHVGPAALGFTVVQSA